MLRSNSNFCGWLILASAAVGLSTAIVNGAEPASATKVSFHKQIKPLFQAHCQGCHQPAKQGGGYEMTSFSRLLKGGESGSAAVVAGKPAASYLLELVTPDKSGRAEMPKGKDPLSATDLELVRRWIAEGAADDSPASTAAVVDAAHPPVYSRAPVVPSLDFSPDGKLLAVAGFHEVLLHERVGDDWTKAPRPAGRLVGLSERVEAVKFSPDGKRLAVAAGLPARLGEVQIWDVAAMKLQLSLPVGYDTVYGVAWSPDAKSVAVGCGDNSVRAFDVATGAQTLFMGGHNDWALDTVYSVDGSHLISVSRDRSAKLTEVETQRFIDNITSITPGALKGGLQSVARHPARDEIVFGGADGIPKIYRVHRITKRVIGDDANLIAVLPGLKGRVFAVDVSNDGKLIAAASSSDGAGEVGIYSYSTDTALPKEIQAVVEKRVMDRTEAESKLLDEHTKKGVKQLAKTEVPDSGLFAAAFTPDAKQLAVAGADGTVRLLSSADGKIVASFVPVPLQKSQSAATSAVAAKLVVPQPALETETLTAGAAVEALVVAPVNVELKNPYDYAQLLVTAKLAGGAAVDVTRMVKIAASSKAVEVLPTGLVVPRADGTGSLTIELAGKQVSLPFKTSGVQAAYPVDYFRDVNPVLTRLGCNQGTCHGSKDGKNGFKLSLRGYDALYDLRAFTDDHASRRVNVAAPDQSLMLLKASGAAPHVGGQLTKPGEAYYELLRAWIAAGAKVDFKTPRVASIEIHPQNPVIDRPGQKQQMRIVARYADGRLRDVTREAFIESGNIETVSTAGGGLMTALRRGEAPVLARFEGAYVATTLTVMGDRTGFEWKAPPTNNRIDELTAAKWQRMKIIPSDLCSDAEFIRRVSIDLTGLPPTADEVRDFLADPRDVRTKRDALVDKLVGGDAYVEHWTNKWADLLQVNPKFLGAEGAKLLRDWIRGEVSANTPYDRFVKKVLTASGSNRETPAASYFKILRDPANTMENTTHLFLAVRFNCNKCHDHPFERWTQDQYYETAAYFAQVGLKADPAAKGATLGGTAVEGGKPLYEMVADMPAGDVKHERTGLVVAPKFPFAAKFDAGPKATRRDQLAAWMTSADNAYFARSYVNRVWGYLFGIGIMEPIDDIRAGNPPTNPELLDYLTQEFIRSGFDVQALVKNICKSRTYQLSVATNRWNADDKINYSHAVAKRLSAEVLYDSIHRVTGAASQFPGYPAGTRAAQLADVGSTMGAGFLQTFGRPVRESACECERTGGMALGPVMAMISGPTLSGAIADPKNELAKLAAAQKDDGKLIDELFLRVLNRPATPKELEIARRAMSEIKADHAALEKKLAEREAWWKPVAAKLEAERGAAVAAAKQELATYEADQAPKVAAAEKARLAAIAAAEKAIADDERRRRHDLPALEKQLGLNDETVLWHPLKITEATARASSPVNLKIEGEGAAVFTTDAGAQPTYFITGETPLTSVTAVMLEVLADERLPGFGPGLNSRNFVLTEIALSGTLGRKRRAPANAAGTTRFVDALATYSQDKFDVKSAIDGKRDQGQQNGWAVAGRGGSQRAVFQLERPIGAPDGTVIKLDLVQTFRAGFSIGKFRLWATDAKKPLSFGAPAAVAAVVRKPADQRTAADRTVLDEYQRGLDPAYLKRETALWTARLPLPIDPKLVELRQKLQSAELPVTIDPQLAQLRSDFEMSKQQTADLRLTTVQDLAWALMNSPAFLFNH